jgi:hypothetical protein
MAGYVHTCAQCGESMVVPARLLGRELRCTSCGTHFKAELPVSAEVEPAWEAPAVPRSGRRLARLLGAVLALCALAAVLLYLGRPRPQALVRGQGAVLGAADQPALHAALDRATFDELRRLDNAPEPERSTRLRQLVEGFRVIEVAGGTRVEVIGQDPGGDAVQVRLLSGRWAEKTVWVTAGAVR